MRAWREGCLEGLCEEEKQPLPGPLGAEEPTGEDCVSVSAVRPRPGRSALWQLSCLKGIETPPQTSLLATGVFLMNLGGERRRLS